MQGLPPKQLFNEIHNYREDWIIVDQGNALFDGITLWLV